MLKILIILFLSAFNADSKAQIVNYFNHGEAAITTGSTTQTLLFHSVPVEASGKMYIRVLARRLSDGATKGWEFGGIYKRNSGDATANIVLLCTLGTSGDLTALLLTSATVDNDGADIRLRITGLLATDMHWYGTMEGDEMEEE